MPDPLLKIAILGAGALPVSVGAFQDALLVHKLDGIEIALWDTDQAALYATADVARRFVQKSGLDVQITPHDDRPRAIDGAAYVLHAATDDAQPARFAADARAIRSMVPHETVSPLGGIAGIAQSLRQIRQLQGVCAEIKQSAADGATLLIVTDPVARLCQAAHDEGVTAFGTSSSSLAAYAFVWQILHDEETAYPFELPRSVLDLSTAGLNRLSFVLDLWDHDTGEDLYDRVKQIVAKGRHANAPLTAQFLIESGYLLAGGDACLQDLLPATGEIPPHPAEDESHAARQRDRRLGALKAVGESKGPLEPLLALRSWERPIDFVAARSFDRPAGAIPGLNMRNTLQLPQLPRGAVVETPAIVDRTSIRPAHFMLPEKLLPMLHRATQLDDTIVRAARWSSEELLAEAIDLDPAIADKQAARIVLDHCLKSHADLLPVFS